MELLDDGRYLVRWRGGDWTDRDGTFTGDRHAAWTAVRALISDGKAWRRVDDHAGRKRAYPSTHACHRGTERYSDRADAGCRWRRGNHGIWADVVRWYSAHSGYLATVIDSVNR